MTQVAVKSLRSGMYVRFQPTRVIRNSDLNNSNLLRVLDTIKPEAPFHMEALALVEEKTKSDGVRFKQTKVLRGVMVSEDLYDDLIASTPALIPYINLFAVIDDFLLPDDRFSRSLTKLGIDQSLKKATYTIPVDGIVDVGVPFEDVTLLVSPGVLIPSDVDGDAGIIEFPTGDAGEVADISFVTQGIHSVMRIERTAVQPSGSDTGPVPNAIYAYVMSPSLATALNVSLPNF